MTDIRDNGGDVRYKKEDNTNNVEVLCVQSKEMRKQLTESKPFVFDLSATAPLEPKRRVTSYIFLSITAISLCQGFCSLQARNDDSRCGKTVHKPCLEKSGCRLLLSFSLNIMAF